MWCLIARLRIIKAVDNISSSPLLITDEILIFFLQEEISNGTPAHLFSQWVIISWNCLPADVVQPPRWELSRARPIGCNSYWPTKSVAWRYSALGVKNRYKVQRKYIINCYIKSKLILHYLGTTILMFWDIFLNSGYSIRQLHCTWASSANILQKWSIQIEHEVRCQRSELITLFHIDNFFDNKELARLLRCLT